MAVNPADSQYLVEQGVPGLVDDMMVALMEAKPADAQGFMCDWIKQRVRPRICVCGGGNAAHVMVGDLGSRGYEVNLYAPFTPPGGVSEAEKFNSTMGPQGIKINYVNEGRHAYGKPHLVSADPKQSIPGCKYIFIPLPVFAHRPTLMDIVPHCDDDATIIAMPATGCFDWTGSQVLKQLGRETITLAGAAPLPYVCRIVDYAKEVNLMGIKDQIGLATLPSGRIEAVACVVEKVLNLRQGAVRYPSFLPITLTPTNPIMHTGRLYGMFGAGGGWRSKSLTKMIKFYDECDEISNEWLHRLNAENQKIAAAADKLIPGSIKGSVKDINMFLKWAYGPDISKWDTCGDCYRTNKQFHGVGSPMSEVSPGKWEPDFKNRYFTEDFPFGLLANRGLAELLGVPTPDMDTVIEWAQKEMGKQWLVGGKINPNEKPQMTPQAFGFSLDDIKRMYS
eukprot:TRINITY_DN1851_c0_g1_i3.p1 TRINITY_DN1851_c0_g1~~TRINITY_DN1851_c0_g1_i3.p1  ORF type:complete len:471 (+),score=186.50 TRINITY_DN1851_c0_g1_i3:66-1415(+)